MNLKMDIFWYSLEQSGDCICATAPHKNVTIWIARYDITALCERKTSHIFRFISAFEHAHPFV